MEQLEFVKKLHELGLSFNNDGIIEREGIIIPEYNCQYKKVEGYKSLNAFEKALVESLYI